MIYGANGYTGQLVAKLAVQRGLRPILAGRRAEPIGKLAQQLGCEARVFALTEPRALLEALEDVQLVLLLAGPFSVTSQPMLEACLHAGAAYLDVTGEIDVFEAVLSRDAAAREAGSVLIPGVGFDVVPTDCLAAMLRRDMPDATHLEIAILGLDGGISRGTLKTFVEGLGRGGRIRRQGVIEHVAAAWATRDVTFPCGTRRVVSMPWGDVSTAYHSTGIGNIVTYFAFPARTIQAMSLLDKAAPVLRTPLVQRAAKSVIGKLVVGPSDARRRRGRSEIWAAVRNSSGQEISRTMITPDGYTLTADSCVRAVQRVLEGAVKPGAYTPSRAFDPAFVLELDGVVVHEAGRASA